MRKFITIALLALLSLSSFAQGVRPTVDPVSDSLAMVQMRARMAEIRKTRPTVALVLSGGGAKGAAHIGVMSYLESIGMPVDMVLGTSMGGLMGALYSLGYSPSYMDSLVRSIDWNLMLSDRVPREYISYNDTRYREKYAFSMPLGARIGVNPRGDSRSLWRSLPSGYIHGQNVNNLISSLTVGYQDSTDFKKLPVPFFCVATDVVSGRAKLWHDGKLNSALRSTMSIPGIFAPVKADGMVLVDGGMRNNYPTDIAKDLGADYVIGVELSDAETGYDEINNLGDLLWKGIDMLGQDAFENNVSIPDVTVKPDLAGYNMMSFERTSIDTIITRGYNAAIDKAAELLDLRYKVGGARSELQNTPAMHIENTPVRVASVDFIGLDSDDIRYLSKKLGLKDNMVLSKSDIDNTVGAIYGTGAFSSVTYELLGTGEPFVLVFNCVKGPRSRIGMGARMDSETGVSAILNFGYNVHALYGDGLEFTGKVGTETLFDAHYMHNNVHGSTFNLDALFKYSDANLYDTGRSRFDISYWQLRQQIYYSNIRWSMSDVKIGLRNEYLHLAKFAGIASDLGNYNTPGMMRDYVSVFLDARMNTLDHVYYPTKGIDFGVYANWIFSGVNNKQGLLESSIDLKEAFHAASHFDIITSFYARLLIGKNVPAAYANLVGGAMAGRYLDQQIPFMGINYATPVSKTAAVLRMDLRYRIGRNHYISAVANTLGHMDNVLSAEEEFKYNLGAGLEYGFNTPVGPLTANIHWSDITKSVGLYFSFGYDF